MQRQSLDQPQIHSENVTTRSTETSSLTITHRPPSILSYPPTMQHGQPLSSLQPFTQSNQSTTPWSLPVPPAQGALQCPPSWLLGQQIHPAAFPLPPVPMQAMIPYQNQTSSDPATIPQRSLGLQTPYTDLSANNQTVPVLRSPPPRVWGARIPCNGVRVHQMMFEIISDENTGDHMPDLKGWWPGFDPTAHSLNPLLHALDPPPLGGYYLLATICDATYVPRNVHLGPRICGDAFLFKINQLQPQADSNRPNLRHAIYEDVPGDLLTSPLLEEITQPGYWKTFSPYNIVRLGSVRKEMRKREAIEQREKQQRLANQREPACEVEEQEAIAHSQSTQVENDARAGGKSKGKKKREKGEKRMTKAEQKAEQKRRHEEMVRENQSLVQTKKVQIERDTRDWEQKVQRDKEERERRERELQERMARERAFADAVMRQYPPQAWISNEQSERHGGVTYGGASAADAMVGLPYQLRSESTISPPTPFEAQQTIASGNVAPTNETHGRSIEEQHLSPSTSRPEPPNTPKPSPQGRQAGTPTTNPSRRTRDALRSSVKKKPPCKRKSKKSGPRNDSPIHGERAAALLNAAVSHDVPESSREEHDGVAPVEGAMSHDAPGLSLEKRQGYMPVEGQSGQDAAELSFEQHHGFGPIEPPASHDTSGLSFEQFHGFIPMEPFASFDPFQPSLDLPNGIIPMDPTASFDPTQSTFEHQHGFLPMDPAASHDTSGISFEQLPGFMPVEGHPSHNAAESSSSEQRCQVPTTAPIAAPACPADDAAAGSAFAQQPEPFSDIVADGFDLADFNPPDFNPADFNPADFNPAEFFPGEQDAAGQWNLQQYN